MSTPGILTQGDLAAGTTDTSNPLGVGGVAWASGSISAAVSAVANGQRQEMLLSEYGCVLISTGPSSFADASSMNADFIMNTSGSAVFLPVMPGAYNGSSIDRPRNNTDQTLLASAARTASTASADQVNYNGHGLMVVLNVTAASGTGGLQVEIQGKDSISGAYYQLNSDPSAVTAAGNYVYILYPDSLDAAANGITQKTQSMLPRTFRVNVKHGDSSSYTYSVSAVNIL